MDENRTSRFVLNYFWGNIITSLASLVSFPIFTRVLSVSDYGILSLVFSTLTIVFVFSKMGIQNSIIRFYPEYDGGVPEKKETFYSTYFFSIMLVGVLCAFIYACFVPLLTKNILSLRNTWPFFAAALFVPTHSFYSVMGNFFRARQEPVLYNILSISETYLPLLFGLSCMLLFNADIAYFFIGGFAGKMIYILHFGKRLRRDHRISPQMISKDLLGKAFLYGFPLMLLELTGNLLAYGDRFLIKYYMETQDVAIYSVGYNLAVYMGNVFVMPLNSAVQVEYMSIWAKGGKEKTEEYLSKTCKAILYLGTISCVIMILDFKYIVRIFASTKYMESVVIAPYVITASVIYSLYPVFGAGIFISKTTKNLIYCVFGALIVNFIANIVLIPRMGIIGAAAATFIANVMAAAAIYIMARRFVSIRIKGKHILFSMFSGVLAYFISNSFEYENLVVNVIVKSPSSLVVFSALIMMLDPEYKDYGRKLYATAKSRFVGAH